MKKRLYRLIGLSIALIGVTIQLPSMWHLTLGLGVLLVGLDVYDIGRADK